ALTSDVESDSRRFRQRLFLDTHHRCCYGPPAYVRTGVTSRTGRRSFQGNIPATQRCFRSPFPVLEHPPNLEHARRIAIAELSPLRHFRGGPEMMTCVPSFRRLIPTWALGVAFVLAALHPAWANVNPPGCSDSSVAVGLGEVRNPPEHRGLRTSPTPTAPAESE